MHFRNHSTIKQHFFVFSTLNIIAVVLAIAITSNILFEKTITEKAKMFQQREVALVCNNIDLLVNSINDYLLTLSVDTTVQDVMRNYDDMPADAEARYNIKLQLLRAVYAKSSLNSYIDSVAVLSQSRTFFDMGPYSESDLNTIIEKNKIDLDNMANKPVWYGPMEMDNALVGRDNVFVVAKPVKDIWSPRTLGYLFVLVKEQTISGFYNNILEEYAEMYVVNEAKEIISSADKSMLYQKISTLNQWNQNSSEFVETTGYISKNNWQVIDYVPKEYLVNEMKDITLSIVNIGIAAILIAFLFSYVIASRVTKPINKLATAMKVYDFTSENAGHVEEVHSSSELNLLTRRFNQLTDRVENLMRQIEKENQQKRAYEFRLIQEQIKPHFLYNSLETIVSLIGISMNQQAMEYTKKLGNFYRISLSGGSDIITLKEELELIRNYLYMQGIRYVDKMTYEIVEIQDSFKYRIPKLTLQPIVENAIYHGIKPKRKKSFLKIQCYREKDDIYISVYDNGVGMKEEQICSLFKKKNQGETHSFGLQSIDDRLKLAFGNHYGLKITSEAEKYTEVVVKIPALEGGNQHDETAARG